MVVVADGDVARNKFRSDGRILPLGYDRNARRVVYDNKEFLLNTVNYLLEEDALISVRSRTIELRSLDSAEVQSRTPAAGNSWPWACLCCLCSSAEAFCWRCADARLLRRLIELNNMHSNLRILYVSIAITAVTVGVWCAGQSEGRLGVHRRHRLCRRGHLQG